MSEAREFTIQGTGSPARSPDHLRHFFVSTLKIRAFSFGTSRGFRPFGSDSLIGLPRRRRFAHALGTLDIFVVIPVYREKESPPEFYQTLAEPLRLLESAKLILCR
jgi:hypothetical protein